MPKPKPKDNSMTCAEAGRMGGQAKVPKGFAMLSPKQMKERSKQAHQARWGTRAKKGK